jgi:hypothetical protein
MRGRYVSHKILNLSKIDMDRIYTEDFDFIRPQTKVVGTIYNK